MRKFLIVVILLFFSKEGFSQCTIDFSSSIMGYTSTFTSLASTSEGNITSFYWDFGDGTKGNTANPTHTYTFPGVYRIKHAAGNKAGTCHDTILKIIRISPPSFVDVSLCPPASTDSLEPGESGKVYQWQVSIDSINYINVDSGNYYSITDHHLLRLNNIPSLFTGYKYRCIVDGGNALQYRLRFVNEWKGTTGSNWSDPTSWRCGTLPDANTDVVLTSGGVTVDVNVSVRSLRVVAPAAVTVQSGVTLKVMH